jgi:hypothetical protein
MVIRQDRFSGNILLYEYLSSKRAPIFLNRNLTRAFQVHRHLLESNDANKLVGEHFDLRMVWKPPSWDSLDEMVEMRNLQGSFILEIHGIKPIHENNIALAEQPDHKRKARFLLRAKSTIQAAVFSPSSDLPCMSIPAQDATLTSTAKYAEKVVSVETDRITIKPEHLNSNVQEIASSNAYKINISINIETHNAAEELYSYLSAKEPSTQQLSTRLSTTWGNILKCPLGRTILPLRDWKGHLAFGLEVTMYWASATGDSILTVHNRRLRETRQPATYPTPPLDPDGGHSEVMLVFAYANEKISRSCLICPHEGCQRRKYADIDDLRMHLDSWHDYFRYKATHQGRNRDGADTWLFECDVADHKAEQRASARADEPYDIRNVAPQQPFHRSRYLNEGNDDYQRMSRLEKRHTSSRNLVAVAPRIPIVPKRKPPDQIQDRPPRESRRYMVPPAPAGVTFVRSCTRRPLKTGESISESDDEVDDRWVKSRRSAEFNNNAELPDPAKPFLKAFDEHMWEEQLRSDVHIGDAVVRFARTHATWVWQHNVFDAYKEKLDELLMDDLVSREVHAACLELTAAQKPEEAEESGTISQQPAQLEVTVPSYSDGTAAPLAREKTTQVIAQRKRDKGKGKARITETGNLTPVTADSDGDVEMMESTLSIGTDSVKDQEKVRIECPPYDLCICGKDALASRVKFSWVACSGMVSSRP